MNPYEKYIDGRKAFPVLSATVGRLKDIVEKQDKVDRGKTNGGGKWDANQIVIHLIHSEINYAVRLRNALVLDDYVVQPFEQELWVGREPEMPLDVAISIFESLRKLNLSLIQQITDSNKTQTFTHPEFGELSVGILLEIMAGHDLNHLGQIENLGR